MQTDIHPDYQAIVFRDLASGETFLTRSTMTSDKTIELDGVTYPLIDVEISSASHPFLRRRWAMAVCEVCRRLANCRVEG